MNMFAQLMGTHIASLGSSQIPTSFQSKNETVFTLVVGPSAAIRVRFPASSRRALHRRSNITPLPRSMPTLPDESTAAGC